jgi:hypothetical protein
VETFKLLVQDCCLFLLIFGTGSLPNNTAVLTVGT